MSSWRRVVLLSLGGIAVVVLSFSITLFVLQTNDNLPLQSVAGVSFVVDPAILRDCDPPVVAKVSWKVAIPSIERVDVFVAGENGDEKLLVGWNEAVGSAKTGAWVRAGAVFLLRDNQTKNQLAKIAVRSKSCN